MIRLGGVLAFFGLVSALLHFTSVQFRLLMWAEPMQPVLGLGLGALGVVIVVAKLAMNKGEPAPDGVPVGQQQQFGPPPGGYVPLPGVHRGGPQQPGGPLFAPQQQFGQQPFPPGGQQFAPGGPQGYGPGPSGPPVAPPPPPGPEPVLGRPQFVPQPMNAQPVPPRPAAPPAGEPQFPQRQQPPRQFGPQG